MFCGKRLKNSDGKSLNFTCQNTRFSTDIKKGFSHSTSSSTKGSVFENYLHKSNGYTLWLEYVINDDKDEDVFWLMWYNEKGCPTISMSAVFSKKDLANIFTQLTNFIP